MLFLGGLVYARGDKKIRKVLAAKRAGGGLKTGQSNAMNFLTLCRIKTRNASAMAKRDP